MGVLLVAAPAVLVLLLVLPPGTPAAMAGICTGIIDPGGILGGTTTWTGKPPGDWTNISRPGPNC